MTFSKLASVSATFQLKKKNKTKLEIDVGELSFELARNVSINLLSILVEVIILTAIYYRNNSNYIEVNGRFLSLKKF